MKVPKAYKHWDIAIRSVTLSDTLTDCCQYSTHYYPINMKPRKSNASTNTDIFLDYWITKSELADVLGVARSTLVIWENIAFWRVEAFRLAYPSKEDGDSDRESPLSPYQAWVLGRIGRTMQRLQRQTRVKDYIVRHPYDFSPHKYQTAHQQVTQIGA